MAHSWKDIDYKKLFQQLEPEVINKNVLCNDDFYLKTLLS